jgi:AraC family transcriptional regulator
MANSEGAYGEVIGRSFGLWRTPKLVTGSLPGSQIALCRLSLGREQLGMSEGVPREDTFVLALYLTKVRHHELWSRGKLYLSQGYAANTIRIVNLAGDFKAMISEPHETLVTYIPRAALNAVTDEHGSRRAPDLRCEAGVFDPVIMNLAAALAPAFTRPQSEVSALFVDHLALAICFHLVEAYGAAPLREAVKGRLSPRQTKRAQDYMSTHCGDDISLADVARECDVSRGYFIRAFRITTGLTPHQWLQQRRVELAQSMLVDSSESIAEIAAACGFADQSHLTRVFGRLVGNSPAAWRRQRQS